MNEQEIRKLKDEYNYNLKRFNNGCKYINEHKEEEDKWMPELQKIYNKMAEIYEKIGKYEPTTGYEIDNGFK